MNKKESNTILFRKIAVAIAFSPRLDALVSEAKRLQKLLRAEMFFVHVGTVRENDVEQFKSLLDKKEFDKTNTHFIHRDGDPVDELLEICRENEVDLLVAGALKKKSLFKYYLGSVARKIIRNADCSVLMLTEPSPQPKPFRKIIVSCIENPKTKETVATAVALAKKEEATEISLVTEAQLYGFAVMMSDTDSEAKAMKTRKSLLAEESRKMDEVLKNIDCTGLRIKTKTLAGKPGHEVSKFARENKADLLVVNSPDYRYGIFDRFFPHDLEYVLVDLPCNLLIVHAKKKKNG